ncbi:hypothetical protein BCEP4_50020 [Burkholderia cepacia]|nr:hypothetical protein BCEP4_50020 [Burkholderia cepacia]
MRTARAARAVRFPRTPASAIESPGFVPKRLFFRPDASPQRCFEHGLSLVPQGFAGIRKRPLPVSHTRFTCVCVRCLDSEPYSHDARHVQGVAR